MQKRVSTMSILCRCGQLNVNAILKCVRWSMSECVTHWSLAKVLYRESVKSDLC